MGKKSKKWKQLSIAVCYKTRDVVSLIVWNKARDAIRIPLIEQIEEQVAALLWLQVSEKTDEKDI